jgi:hypothetical protein
MLAAWKSSISPGPFDRQVTVEKYGSARDWPGIGMAAAGIEPAFKGFADLCLFQLGYAAPQKSRPSKIQNQTTLLLNKPTVRLPRLPALRDGAPGRSRPIADLAATPHETHGIPYGYAKAYRALNRNFKLSVWV